MDLLVKQKNEIVAKINQAMKDGDEAAFAAAFTEYTDMLQEAVMAEAKGLVQAADNQILAGRGVRALTSEETKYYQKIIEAMKSSNPKQALSGFDAVLPETIINAVFEDITEEHPLLSEIRFDNASALIKWLYSTMDGRFLAWWGPLCGEIKKQLAAQFNYLNLEQTKLSAFVPVCKAMLDLGPAWLDRYVRTILAEAIANGLEQGIISGRGLADQAADPEDRIYEPIGMDRDLTVFDNTTGYAPKVPIPVTQFTPAVYGDLASRLAVGPNLLNRTVTQLLMVVNPVDYLNKVMPATAFQRPDGSWVRDILPLPTKIVQSAYVEQGKAILGLAKRYIMAMGTGKGGRIEYSDEYRFLEDERTYLIKLYGTG
ncbi:phage major capsid protein, partial [Candidatus Darwinibacter acetoxidans]